MWLSYRDRSQQRTESNQLHSYAQTTLIYADIYNAVKQDQLDSALQLIKHNRYLLWNKCANDRDGNNMTLLGRVIEKEDAGKLTLQILKWKIDLSKNARYYSDALLIAVYWKRTKNCNNTM
jgi:hypothetical protein